MSDEIGIAPADGTAELMVVESAESISAERLELGRQCFELKLAGKTNDEIAAEVGVSRSTVVRRLKDYGEMFAQQLIGTPRKHLLAEEVARLNSLETEARSEARMASTPSAKNAFLKTALLAIGKRLSLLLESGVIPREPQMLLTAHVPQEDKRTKHPDDRTDEEIKQDIMVLLRQSRRL